MKKVLALALSLVLATSLLAGCGSSGGAGGEASSTSAGTSGSTSSSGDFSKVKIGVLLSGSAKDGGWSQMAADAVADVESTYGCTVNYSESVPATDYESVMRGYADQGYNIIVAHGAEFLDTTLQVAKDYPGIRFINTSASQDAMGGAPDNVTGIDFGTYQLGFLAGAASAMASENGKIGAIGSNQIAAIVAWTKGVEDGAKYINPNAVVITAFTGSYDDQVKAKQCTDSLADQGCDVITQNADACGKGAVQECDALGLKNVGTVSDETKEGQSCFLSVIQDAKEGITLAVGDALQGKLAAGFVDMGPVQDVTRYSDFSGTYKDILTQDQKDTLTKLMDQLHAGADLSALTKG